MNPNKLIVIFIILAAMLFVGLSTPTIADKSIQWVEEHPQDPGAPRVLFRAHRWCDWMGDNLNSIKLALELYKRYPNENALCAEALYHSGVMASQTAARRSANDYLKIIIERYDSEEKWRVKAKELWDEVNYAH